MVLQIFGKNLPKTPLKSQCWLIKSFKEVEGIEVENKKRQEKIIISIKGGQLQDKKA